MLNNTHLVNDPFVGEIAQSIIDLYDAHGNPDGSHRVRFQMNASMFCRLSGADMGDWQGAEEAAAEAFNAAVVRLFEMLDFVEVGHGMWTRGHDISEAYRAFRDEALEQIEHWLAYDAFDLFCNDPYEI